MARASGPRSRSFARPKSRIFACSAVAAVNDHQIFRLEIAMDDARLVRLGQPRTDLNEEARRARKSPRPFAPEQRREIVALDELHHEIERAVGLAEVERLHDVRVIELADRLRLEAKATNRFSLFCGLGRQHLHRGGLAEVQMLDAIDDAHAARPEPRLHAITPVDYAAQPRIGRRGHLRRVRAGEQHAAMAAESQPSRQGRRALRTR